ncbi:SBDS protein C-terminal domain-containing protein [Podospora didyma]|uniref:Ribosome maturation protein SDO1 n=1 Tax=Podospora didyma TaxID=330526 RepID=A0AAE0N2S2_9PEZI|nr:SBDS protein C-terminal domain-containing protein [Podospora didyma]
MPIQQPSNQIKLTNVSLVRLKKGKKRFEIACYKNKVLEWRSGIETDLDNVLQIPNVFLNVSKGQTAPSSELTKAFGASTSTDAIILEILKKGELQVGEKERTAQLERVHHEVVGIVASKLVDPRTKHVYTTGMIEKALDMLSSQAHTTTNNNNNKDKDTTTTATSASTTAPEKAEEEEENGDEKKNKEEEKEAQPAAAAAPKPTWTGVVASKSAKSQALDAMKALIAHQPIPVARARMKLRITCPTPVLKQSVKTQKPPHHHTAAHGSHSHGHKGEDGDANAESKAQQQQQHGTVKDKILSYIELVEHQDVVGSEWEVVGFAEPGAFKGLSDFIGGETKGQGRIEVLDMDVTHED